MNMENVQKVIDHYLFDVKQEKKDQKYGLWQRSLLAGRT